MKQIIVRIKNVYGKDGIYPACGDSFIFACIAGTTCLTPRAITLIKQLGYVVTVHDDAGERLNQLIGEG